MKKTRIAWNKGNRSSKITHKFCFSCNKKYLKDPDSCNKQWEKRKFCSKHCALIGNTRTLGKNLGKDNAAWKGGATSINASLRSSYEMNEWRKKVFKRDGYTCQSCACKGKMEAHHILSFANFPEHRFEIKNGLTLCPKCHKLTDNYGSKTR